MTQFLIVDDDTIDREIVTRALHDHYRNRDEEISALEAVSCKEALIFLQEETIDCLILDYRLPDCDGIGFLKKMKEKFDDFSVPVVMLTGEGNEHIAVEAMKMGVLDYLPKNNLTSAFLITAIRSAIEKGNIRRQLKETIKVNEQLALYDSLTGLGNRNLFNAQIAHFISYAKRNKEHFSLFVMDLDGFKKINDNLGHRAGDLLLAEIGRRLKSVTRSADLVFRIGGDEFAALFNTGATLPGARIVARKIIDIVGQPIALEEKNQQVGISIGIALFPEHGTDPETLFNQADAAMYAAKRRGGGLFFASV
ncbi:MAG: GGDEF domain-containing response regulator [Deltaproteobacteria bacterium]|nr:GGDEF domain-containing response regulator [Deltaproteobacteria bacterium]